MRFKIVPIRVTLYYENMKLTYVIIIKYNLLTESYKDVKIIFIKN